MSSGQPGWLYTGGMRDTNKYIAFKPSGIAFEPQRQGHDCVHIFHYNIAHADPAILEAYCYTDRISYRPGDVVSIHASATAAQVDITIIRDGSTMQVVAQFAALAAESAATPDNFYSEGCGWPVLLEWTIPEATRSGFYLVRISARRDGQLVEHEHGFCVRPSPTAPKARVLFLLSTCTWTAYNDWGGINNYVGAKPPEGLHFAPRLSLHRPFARGLIDSAQ